MKKSFFKKLSFVLALAMIVSVIAPASGAFAATSPAINTAKKYLYLGETGKNEYDFHIDNKAKGSTYKWSSADENIAVVDAKTGYTTAVAVGTTTVKCTIKTTKKTYTSETSVIVKDNIKSLAITNKPAGDKLAIGASNDFNRTFTTFGGSTTKTTAVTKWAVADKDGKATTDATIDKSGVFTATKAGTYTVVAAAFQSGATYASFVTSQDTKLVLAKDTTTVTVAPSVTAVKQINSTKFSVTFDSDMSKTDLSKTTATVAQVVSGKEVTTGAEKIKSLSLDSTGKVATVEIYASFNQEVKYVFHYGDLNGSFTSAKKDVKLITGIVFADFNASISSANSMLSSVSAVNADGVVIYSGSDIASYLTFTYTGDASKASAVGSSAYFYSKGYQGTFTATFNNYLYDTATSSYKAVKFSDDAVGTGVVGTAALANSIQFEVVSDATQDNDVTWEGTAKLAATDKNYVIQARYYDNNHTSAYQYSNNTSVFKYESSDTSKLAINGNLVYAYAAGVVTIIVKDTDGNAVSTFDVTIEAARDIVSATADNNTVTLGNNVAAAENKTVTISLTDTVGDPMWYTNWSTVGKEDPGAYVIESNGFINLPSDAGILNSNVTVTPGDDSKKATRGKVSVKFTAPNAKVGVYQYKLVFSHNYSNNKKEVILNLIVVDGKTNTSVSYWKVDVDKPVVKMSENYNTTIIARLHGYNTEGAVVKTLTPGTALDPHDYYIKIFNSTNDDKTQNVVASGDALYITVCTGAASSKVAWGNYESYWATNSFAVNAYVKNVAAFTGTPYTTVDALCGTGAFGVNLDKTQSFTMDKNAVVSGTSLLAAVSDCVTYTVNGTKLLSTDEMANIYSVDYSIGNAVTTSWYPAGVTLSAGQTVFVSKVCYKVVDPNGSTSFISYDFSINQTITVTAN